MYWAFILLHLQLSEKGALHQFKTSKEFSYMCMYQTNGKHCTAVKSNKVSALTWQAWREEASHDEVQLMLVKEKTPRLLI